MTYNILNGHLNVDETTLLQEHGQQLEGSCKLFKQFAFREVRQNYFSHHVVNNWNSLPSGVVDARSTDEFKKLFDNLNNEIMFSIDLL